MRALAAISTLLIACGGAPARPQAPTCPPPAPPTPEAARAPTLDEAAVTAKSHAFFDAMDTADINAFRDATGKSFLHFENQRFFPREFMLKALQGRRDRNAPARTRTWKDEHVYVDATNAVFIGLAVEHLPDDGPRKAFDDEGWHTLVWVPDGAVWKVVHYQWQKGGLEVERDNWNEIFRRGSGFKQAANQTLIDAVKGRKPGAALDLAMGQGRNAIFLAAHGWKVTGVDISDEGIRVANETAAKQKLKLETIRADIDTWDLGKEKWDLVTMIYAGDDDKMIERIKPSLKKGGLFVLEYYHAESVASKMGIGGWKTGQLAELFKTGFKIVRDDVVDDVSDWSLKNDKLVRFVAQKE